MQELKFRRQNNYNMKYFDFHAILIQKVFRGYKSRKYEHSYYHRKDCLAKIKVKDEEVRNMMRLHVTEQENTMKVKFCAHTRKSK